MAKATTPKKPTEPTAPKSTDPAAGAAAPPAPDQTQEQAAAGQPQSYVAKTHINHDGVDYFDGDPIDLTEPHAKPLRDCGAIEAAA